ncbi:MAG: polysaccharide pyruvyl transferase family protein [Clostridium sp.]|nr:polysaccharide pyruvyl transferase family protein [Clostridium sp.]
MKVGILTASRTNNNGTDLQALAMLKIFKKFNSNVELINYKCCKLENSRKFFYPKTLRGFLQIPWSIYNHYVHEKFRKKYFIYSKKIFDSSSIDNNYYDVIIVGSDQIWNLDITGGDLGFFLPFNLKKQKKYSYAASLGKIDIKDWNNKYNLEKKLKNFTCISVREKSAVEALLQIGVLARFDLDPLLMLTQKEWNIYKSDTKYNKKYIFIYVVDRAKEAIEYAINYAKQHNLDVIFCGNVIKPIYNVKVIRFCNLENWITYVSNAELVITNSYHCLSFCVLYHRKFVIYSLSKSIESNTRLNNLLKIINLQDMIDERIYNPDWIEVDEIINLLREKSYSYISEILIENQ